MKKWMMALVLLVLIAAVGLTPAWVLNRAERYQVVTPTVIAYQNSIRCTGALYPRYSCQVMATGLYEIEEVYVSLGQEVEQGEAVARVKSVEDQPFFTYQTRDFEENVQSASQLEALAQLYSGSESMPENFDWQTAQSYLGENKDAQEKELLVTSPIAGVIASRLPIAGTVIRSGESLYRVNSNQTWTVAVSVSESQAGEVHLGDPVKITGDQFGSGEQWGTLTGISPQTRRSFNGTGYDTVVDLEISLEDTRGNYTAGSGVKVEIFTEDSRELFILPYETFYQNEENEEYIFVATKQGLIPRIIQTGAELAEGVEITQGLSREERVAIAPKGQEAVAKVYLLKEGS